MANPLATIQAAMNLSDEPVQEMLRDAYDGIEPLRKVLAEQSCPRYFGMTAEGCATANRIYPTCRYCTAIKPFVSRCSGDSQP